MREIFRYSLTQTYFKISVLQKNILGRYLQIRNNYKTELMKHSMPVLLKIQAKLKKNGTKIALSNFHL